MIAIATLNLAAKLHDDLLAPRELRSNGSQDYYVVKGGIRLKGGSALCSFFVAPNWITRRPDVICHEPWLKKECDWHAFPDGSLCYVYAPEWMDLVSRTSEHGGMIAAADAARVWLTRNVAWLLNKHLLADELGLTKWQKDWPSWPHGSEKAKQEYDKQR